MRIVRKNGKYHQICSLTWEATEDMCSMSALSGVKFLAKLT